MENVVAVALNINCRFVDTETWRKQVPNVDLSPANLDELVASWDWPEKDAISKYYPQYYHKTDKVSVLS